MKSSMFDLFLARAAGGRIEAWQICQKVVTEDEARRRLSLIELSSEDLCGPEGGEPADREALDGEAFGAQAWTSKRAIFTIGTYEGSMWVYSVPRNPPEGMHS